MFSLIDKIKKFALQRKLLSGIIIATLLTIGGFYFLNARKPKPESTIVKKETIKQELSLSGEIEAEEKASLSFGTGGLVSWVGVKEGDYVTQYQGIASLDQRSAKKALEKTLLDYLLQRSEFDETREENLNRTAEQAISNEMKRILERNQWNLEKAVNSVEMQDLVIQLSTISSPISGLVTKVVTKYPGVNIAPFSAQFEIVNPESIYFRVSADQTEVVNIKNGTKGIIVFDAYEDEEITGAIFDISFSQKEEESGTVYNVKVTLNGIDNSTYKYRLGMTGDITFVTDSKPNVLSLPLNFVKTDQKGKYVYIDKNKKRKQYIETGLEGEDLIEVKGIYEGTVAYD